MKEHTRLYQMYVGLIAQIIHFVLTFLQACLYMPVFPLLDARLVQALGAILCQTHGSYRHEGTVVGNSNLHLCHRHSRVCLARSHHRSVLP